MSDKEDLTHQLESVKHGKASIAIALKELGLTQEALERSSRIEERQFVQQSEMDNLQSQLKETISLSVFNQRVEELSLQLDKRMRKNLEEISNNFFDQLSKKISVTDMEESLKQKVNWSNFTTLSQQLSTVKTRLDKFVGSEFEGFKTKMKIELSHKANEAEDLHADLLNNEEIIQIKSRISMLEQRVKEIASGAEEVLLEDDKDEEYDSEEELDNMNEDDLVRAVMKNKAEERNLTPNIESETTLATTQREEFKGVPPPPQANEAQNIKLEMEIKYEETSDLKSEQLGGPVKQSSEIMYHTEQNIPQRVDPDQKPESEITPVQQIESEIKIEQIPTEKIESERKIEQIQTQKIESELKIEQIPTQRIDSEQTQTQQKDSEQTQAQQIEEETKHTKNIIPEQKPETQPPEETPGKQEGKETDSEHKASRTGRSKAGSRASSIDRNLAGANAIGQVNKKITQIRKEMETYETTLGEIKDLILGTEREIEFTNSSIDGVKSKISTLQESMVKMEQSFVKALRRKKPEKKLKNEPQPGVPFKQIESLQKSIEEKHVRIVALESFIDKIINDTNQLKSLQRDKMNEIVQSLHFLDAARNTHLRNMNRLEANQNTKNSNYESEMSEMKNDIGELKGPITDLISNQQRETATLTDGFQRQNNLFRTIAEEYVSSVDSNAPVSAKNSARVRTASPLLSLNQRFTLTAAGTRLNSPLKTDTNWVKTIPVGHNIVLPRVSYTSKNEKNKPQTQEEAKNETFKLPERVGRRKRINKLSL